MFIMLFLGMYPATDHRRPATICERLPSAYCFRLLWLLLLLLLVMISRAWGLPPAGDQLSFQFAREGSWLHRLATVRDYYATFAQQPMLVVDDDNEHLRYILHQNT
jgi:hypothetical protein